MNTELWVVVRHVKGNQEELESVVLEKGSSWKDAMTACFGDDVDVWNELPLNLEKAQDECYNCKDMQINAKKIPKATLDKLNS